MRNHDRKASDFAPSEKKEIVQDQVRDPSSVILSAHLRNKFNPTHDKKHPPRTEWC